ncbi:EF-P beta-lysylation protein EpmB [Rubripirellula lacrimiformis]|uniref:EF-P beta-lysylation protein EpmB n=1 Tax=Rubripirellula lacrimiformis TaxID=1930273 RepID=UPI001FE7DB08|nr:EF-P beta-lysylation protein EpmB [Rubripirellula lacrimiformis]
MTENDRNEHPAVQPSQAEFPGSTNQVGEILTGTTDLVPVPSQSPQNPENPGVCGEVSWQTAMKRAIRRSNQLRAAVGLPVTAEPHAEADFPTFAPLEYVRRMIPGDPHDPLLRQVLPIAAEDQTDQPGFSSDPVGDMGALVAGGLLHKYHGRALVVTTGACGVHCRYCFRREFPYSESGSQNQDYAPAIEYLSRKTDIDEVILSGGDPLTLVDDKIDRLLSQLEAIPHLRRLRIHSRMPIVIPQRITELLVRRLRQSRLATWMVVHANHPAELDHHVIDACGRLVDAGIPVLNQAVLLRGVNDDADTLESLCRRLVDHRIQPYYLHQLDRVTGAAHFEVSEAEGQSLVDTLRTRLPGYAVPTYVIEQSGQASKTPIP